MRRNGCSWLGLALTLVFSWQLNAQAQFVEEETVRAATVVLNETMATPLNRIPQAMMANAHGVAIIPNVIKGGFIVGARHGRGVLFVREANGTWHAPVFITLTGGNIGWQVGVQSSDIVLVFRTAKSVQGVLSGKFTIGADAAAAAGPLGRQGSVATDGQLQAEIYSYSRSRGLFVGVSIDGSVLSVDQMANGNFYRSTAPGQPVTVPASAQQLTQLVASYTGSSTPSETTQQTPVLAEQYGASEPEVLRGQLQQLAPKLLELLDQRWREYLSLPSEIFVGREHPSVDALQSALSHYELVATNSQWQELAARPEFQSVYGLLKHYHQSLSVATGKMQLPPPPASSRLVLPE
jgi:SH3 domain-containing YSC84-like protein 1